MLSGPPLINQPTAPFHEIVLSTLAAHDKTIGDERPAIMDVLVKSHAVTYGQLLERSQAIAGWLQNNGFEKGQVAFLLMSNRWEYVCCALGLWSAGLAVTGSNPKATPYELNLQIEDSQSVIVFTDVPNTICDSLPSRVRSVVSLSNLEGPSPVVSCTGPPATPFTTIISHPPIISRPKVDLDDLLSLPYSSGTTGLPKGVMISHRAYASLIYMFKQIKDSDIAKFGNSEVNKSEYQMAFTPFYHAMGTFVLMANLIAGKTILGMRKFSISAFLQCIQDYKIDQVSVVPAVAQLIAVSPISKNYDLSSLHVLIVGAAPFPPATQSMLKKQYPNLHVRQAYGMSEVSALSHLAEAGVESKSVGRLLPGTEAKVLLPNGQLAPPHVEGELWVRGPQLMMGYWRRKEETYKVMDKDGFMRTGDVVTYDKDGLFYVCDRVKELIKVKGLQVAPAELEAILLEHPSVTDCAVIGIPDPAAGEIPRGYVVMRDGAEISIDQLNTHVNQRVSAYKWLVGGIVCVSVIPRNPTGKILRRTLLKEYLDSHHS